MHWLYKISFIALLLLVAAFNLHAQDTSWTIIKADKVFSLAMPKNFLRTDFADTMKDRIAKSVMIDADHGFITMRIVKDPAVEKLKDNKEMVLSNVESDLKDQGRQMGLTPIFSDTVISNVKGLKGVLYNEDDIRKLGYFFLVEGKLYSVIYTKDTASEANYYPDFQRVLNSIHFSSPEATDTSEVVTIVQPTQENNNKEGLSGELIACIVLVIIIVGVILYLKLRN